MTKVKREETHKTAGAQDDTGAARDKDTAEDRQGSTLDAIRNEMDQFWERLQSRDWSLPRMGEGTDWRLPRLPDWQISLPSNLIETESGFRLTAELPGMTDDSVHVKLIDNKLVLNAEKREATEEQVGEVHISERRFGRVQRSFKVPEGVDADKIEAEMQDGVLTVRMPKTAAARATAKTIAVKHKPPKPRTARP